MRKIITITHVSLDGVMQAPGGPKEDPSQGFKHGGWAMLFPDDDQGEAIGELMSRKFDMLLGRRTYDIFAGYWPHHGDNFIGKAFNAAKKHVVSRKLKKLAWENSHLVGKDAVKEIRKLKRSKGPEIHVWGSGNLLQTLIAADLIDEYRMWVYPVILGKGKRLFENGVPPRRLSLVESRRTKSGVLLNTYHPDLPLPDA
jgi:dihydrofolate reductase